MVRARPSGSESSKRASRSSSGAGIAPPHEESDGPWPGLFYRRREDRPEGALMRRREKESAPPADASASPITETTHTEGHSHHIPRTGERLVACAYLLDSGHYCHEWAACGRMP